MLLQEVLRKKGTPNHILVNKVLSSRGDFYSYCNLVVEDIGYEKEVCTISKYDDVFECIKYFKDLRYSLYIYENDKLYYEMEEF